MSPYFNRRTRLLTGSTKPLPVGEEGEGRTGRNREYHEALQASDTTIFFSVVVGSVVFMSAGHNSLRAKRVLHLTVCCQLHCPKSGHKMMLPFGKWSGFANEVCLRHNEVALTGKRNRINRVCWYYFFWLCNFRFYNCKAIMWDFFCI